MNTYGKTDRVRTAIALKYSGEGAPRVTAKGDGDLGDLILELAQQHDIPLYEDQELAGLLSHVELGKEIPETLYLAVAEVLSFVYDILGPQDERS